MDSRCKAWREGSLAKSLNPCKTCCTTLSVRDSVVFPRNGREVPGEDWLSPFRPLSASGPAQTFHLASIERAWAAQPIPDTDAMACNRS